MTRYKAWPADDSSCPRTFDAWGPSDAAEQWASEDDSDSADYAIVQGEEATVIVEDMITGERRVFSVTGETEPVYHAGELDVPTLRTRITRIAAQLPGRIAAVRAVFGDDEALERHERSRWAMVGRDLGIAYRELWTVADALANYDPLG